jgi:Skp family chaperone for outer membrane proteins
MKIAHMIVLFFVWILIAFAQSDAQDQLPLKGPAAERIAHYKKLRLMEAVPMNEETSVRFFSRYQKHEENIRVIGKERNTLIDQLQDMVKANAIDADMENTIKDISMSEEKVLEERAKFIEELKDILSVKQISEYIVFERNFNKNLRELMRDVAKDRWNRKNK